MFPKRTKAADGQYNGNGTPIPSPPQTPQNCYWTGFFTSRPGLKRLERVTSGYLQAARQLHALAGVEGDKGEELLSWRALEALEVKTEMQLINGDTKIRAVGTLL